MAAVEVAKRLKARTVLVIAPVNTFDTWAETFTRQKFEHPVHVIKNTKAGRAAYARLLAGEPGAYIIGTQMFALSATYRPPNPEFIVKNGQRKPHPAAGKGERKKWTSWTRVSKVLDLAVLDESHKASNRNSLMFSVLKNLRPKVKLAMSATPMGNNFEGIWAPCRWLWPDHEDIVPQSFWKWAARNCKVEKNPHGTDEHSKRVVGEKVPGRFVKTLPCYLYYKAPKKPTDTLRVHVELTPAQRKMYDDMEQLSIAWLNEHPLIVDLPLVQKIRLRQMALGEVTLTPDGEVDFAPDCASSKIDACEKIIARHPGEQIVFFVDSQRFARVLAHRLGPEAAEWSGVVSAKNRARIKADFLDGATRYLVATIASVGTGTDLLQTVCHTEVWVNKSFDGVANEQAEGRLNRTGQQAARITRYELVASKSDDAKYLDRLVQQTRANMASLHL